MAIHPAVPGIAVTIHNATDDDTPLPEYDVPEELESLFIVGSSQGTAASSRPGATSSAAKTRVGAASAKQVSPLEPATATKLVESVANAVFRIRVAFDPALPEDFLDDRDQLPLDVQARVFVDGCKIQYKPWEAADVQDVWAQGEWGEFINGSWRKAGKEGGRRKAGGKAQLEERWVEKALQFSGFHVASGEENNESSLQQCKVKDAFGSIVVELWLGRIGDVAKGNNRNYETVACPESLPENKVKGKGISHGVSMLPGREIDPPQVEYFELAGKYPVVVFKFCYRSKDALERYGVIHREKISRENMPIAVPDVMETKKTAAQLSVQDLRDMLRYHEAKAREQNLEKAALSVNEDERKIIQAGIDPEVIYISTTPADPANTTHPSDEDEKKFLPINIPPDDDLEVEYVRKKLGPKDIARRRLELEQRSHISINRTEEPIPQEAISSQRFSTPHNIISAAHEPCTSNNVKSNPRLAADKLQLNSQELPSQSLHKQKSRNESASRDNVTAKSPFAAAQNGEAQAHARAQSSSHESIDNRLQPPRHEPAEQSLFLPGSGLPRHLTPNLDPSLRSSSEQASLTPGIDATARGHGPETPVEATGALSPANVQPAQNSRSMKSRGAGKQQGPKRSAAKPATGGPTDGEAAKKRPPRKTPAGAAGVKRNANDDDEDLFRRAKALRNGMRSSKTNVAHKGNGALLTPDRLPYFPGKDPSGTQELYPSNVLSRMQEDQQKTRSGF